MTCISYRYGQKHSIEVSKATENIERLQKRGLPVEQKIIDLTSAMSSFHSALTNQNFEIPEGHYEEEHEIDLFTRNAIFSSILWNGTKCIFN